MSRMRKQNATAGLTSQAVYTYLGLYFRQTSAKDLRAMADQGARLRDALEPYEGLIKPVRRLTGKVYADADEVLSWALRQHPAHGDVLFDHAEWYERELADLVDYVNCL